MCSTKVMAVVEAETARRKFLRSVGAAAMGVSAAAGLRADDRSTGSPRVGRTVRFGRVIDLTHVLEPNIPNYFRLNIRRFGGRLCLNASVLRPGPVEEGDTAELGDQTFA